MGDIKSSKQLGDDSGKKSSKIRRGKKLRQNKERNLKFKVLGTNANGISSKLESFNNLIAKEKPACFMLQETKLKRTGKIKMRGYQIFETARKKKKLGD